jgi:hypothetical protein
MMKKKTATTGPRAGDYAELPIRDVLEDPANENVHPDDQIEGIRASIRLYGQQEPVLVDLNKVCVAHHGVLRAMKLEGRETVECRYTDLKGAARAGYRIAANALGRRSHFDDALLAANVRGIRDERGDDFHPEMLGMGVQEFAALLGGGWKGRQLDAEQIGDYDPAREQFLIKIAGVSAADKDALLARVGAALEGTGYAAQAY